MLFILKTILTLRIQDISNINSEAKNIIPIKYINYHLTIDPDTMKIGVTKKNKARNLEDFVVFYKSKNYEGNYLQINGIPVCYSSLHELEPCSDYRNNTVWNLKKYSKGYTICTRIRNGSNKPNFVDYCIKVSKKSKKAGSDDDIFVVSSSRLNVNDRDQLFYINSLPLSIRY